MGYDLHITRRRRWGGSGPEITAQEWLAYVERDSDLRINSEEGPYFAEWAPSAAESASPLWLAWSDGEISTKNPSDELIDKMVSIADALNAMVQGDDGEFYEGGDLPPREIPPSRYERTVGWLERLLYRLRSIVPRRRVHVSFAVGDRIRISGDPREYTVLEMDPDNYLFRFRSEDGSERAMMIHPSQIEPAIDPHLP